MAAAQIAQVSQLLYAACCFLLPASCRLLLLLRSCIAAFCRSRLCSLRSPGRLRCCAFVPCPTSACAMSLSCDSRRCRLSYV